MLKYKKFSPIFLWVGVTIPAVLSLNFIFAYGLRTIFWDEWSSVRFFLSFFSGKEWFLDIIIQHNEHIPFFPNLINLILAYLTSFDVFSEVIVGWIFRALILLVLWLLLRQTVPEARWLIIPIAWLTFSFSQFGTSLWGYTSIQWYLTILSVVTSIYFLNKINHSKVSIIPSIACGIVASFSSLLGLLVWFVGIFKFKKMLRTHLKFLLAFSIIGIITFIIYFASYDQPSHHPDPLSSFSFPEKLITYILIYLQNGPTLEGLNSLEGVDGKIVAPITGAIFLAMFVIMSILNYRFSIGNIGNHNTIVWFQIALFGILSAIVTGIGRSELGVLQAFTPRYTPISALFIEGTLVLTVVVFIHMIRGAKTNNHRRILISIFIFLLIIFFLHIAVGYILDYSVAVDWAENISSAHPCLLNYQTAPPDCLEKLHPNFDDVKTLAAILEELCLGPFAKNCS